MTTTTIRLTTAQALVRWMIAQRSELLDGTEVPLFPGVFGIFGHGNVLGLGTALYDVRDELPTWRGSTEQGMALAAVAYARATDRRQVMVATSSVGPGALNMVTAAGVAHANRFLPAADPPAGPGHVDLRRRLLLDAQLRALQRRLRRPPVCRRGLRQRRLRGDPPASDQSGR